MLETVKLLFPTHQTPMVKFQRINNSVFPSQEGLNSMLTFLNSKFPSPSSSSPLSIKLAFCEAKRICSLFGRSLDLMVRGKICLLYQANTRGDLDELPNKRKVSTDLFLHKANSQNQENDNTPYIPGGV